MTGNTPSADGLSAQAAAERLSREGYNELPAQKPRSVLAIGFEVAREPMPLLAAGAVYLVPGDVQPALIVPSESFPVVRCQWFDERCAG